MGQKLQQIRDERNLNDLSCAYLINSGMTAHGFDRIDKAKIIYAINNNISPTSESLMSYVLIKQYDEISSICPDMLESGAIDDLSMSIPVDAP